MGSQENQEQLVRELYDELRRRAAAYMRRQPGDHTLQPTALVNEAYMRLCGDETPTWENRVHFLATASKAMRHVLVDHARTKGRSKRTPPGERLPMDTVVVTYEDRSLDLVALDEALDKLATFDAPMARAVELRFFGGLDVSETARLLGISRRTFERRWKAVRTWLYAEVQ